MECEGEIRSTHTYSSLRKRDIANHGFNVTQPILSGVTEAIFEFPLYGPGNRQET